MTALTTLGPHLLGRVKMPPDERDYQLGDYLASHAKAQGTLTPDTTLAMLEQAGPLTEWHEVYAFWAWFKEHVLHHPKPQPAPGPGNALCWPHHGPISDQGQTPHCVGFTGLDWGDTDPVDDAWPNPQGHYFYYQCKVVDGEPGAETGSHSRSLCTVLRQQGRLSAYAFAASADEAAAYVLEHGPVGIGIDWYQDMFSPSRADGYVLSLSGGVAGGHEITLRGYDSSSELFLLTNHWTDQWADAGEAYLRKADLDRLLRAGGDCWAALESPLP